MATFTWLPNPQDDNFDNANNWTNPFNPGGVPGANDTATFGFSTVTQLVVSASATVDTLQFEAGAPAYSFFVTGFGVSFDLLGIDNQSSNTEFFSVAIDSVIGFEGGAIVGAVNLTADSGGSFGGSSIVFTADSSAGNATITVDNSSNLSFGGTSTAGEARLIVNPGGVADFSFDTSTSLTAGSIEGGGIFALGSEQLTVGGNNLSTIVSGSIEDGGSNGSSAGGASLVKVGRGTLTLTGSNTYTGGTTIESGTLQVGNGGASGSLTGNVTDDAAFAIDLSGTFTFGGIIAGTGAFAQLGSGTTILTAADDYTGGTTVSAGTLRLGAGGSLAGGGALTINGGTFDLNDTNQTIGDLSGTGGTLALDGATLIAGTANSTSFAGTITGPGVLTKMGTGTLTLPGNSTYTGTMIDAGTLQLGNGGTSGSIVGFLLDDGVLAVDRSDTATIGATITGSGIFEQLGTGTTILTAADQFGGGAIIGAGTLQLGNGGSGGSITGNVTDDGAFVVDESGTVTLSGNISGTGPFTQTGTGTTILKGADSTNGDTTISAGTLELGIGGSVVHTVTFADAGNAETLRLDTGANQLGGSIVGFAHNDAVDLSFLGFNSSLSAVWQENAGNTGGTLSLDENGATLASLNLSGQYVSANFALTSDGHGGTAIGFQNAPPPAGTTADMILTNPSTGDYEIDDIGNNAILASDQLTNIPLPSQAVALGNFSGTDTTDMAVRNGTSFQYYDVADNNVTQTGVMGAVGTNWSVVGTGKFDNSGFTDIMMHDSSTGAYDIFDIRNNQITGATQIAAVGSNWQVAGFADFNGDGTADMLLQNTGNGALEYYDIANGQVTSAGILGTVGTNWQAVGFGNFDNSGFADMMMYDSADGAYELFDIRNNSIIGAQQIAAVGTNWQVAGFADVNGDGTTDMVLRNTSTGAFEYYDIANGQVTAEGALGQAGTQWNIVGITTGATAGAAQSQSQSAPGTDLSEVVPPMSSFLSAPAPMTGLSATAPQFSSAAPLLAADPLQHAV